jgi:type I restriction enzyme S subunit
LGKLKKNLKMMKSNYKRLGDYITEVKERNTELKAEKLLGININKFFMPSVANIVGTDMSVYKIVKKNQFACNRMHVGRDYRLPVSMSKTDEEFMVSPAYDVFEIINTDTLYPEYLMMWFSRREFDRNAWFYTDADVRGGLHWKALSDMQLPIPSIAKQREIVKEYNVIQNRIVLNQQLIQKLEETAQAIYKQWFVDFEFPDENGKPYKSNGGEMVFNKELEKEIPLGWRMGSLSDLVDVIDGDRGSNYPSIEEMNTSGFCLFLNAGNVTKIGFDFSETKFITKEKDNELRKGKLKRNDIVLTSRGTVGNVAFFSEAITFNDIRINSGMVIMRAKEFSEAAIFIYSMLRNSEIKKSIENYLSGSAQPQLPIKDLIKIPIFVPEKKIILLFSTLSMPIQTQIDKIKIQGLKLEDFKNLLLSKLANIEK